MKSLACCTVVLVFLFFNSFSAHSTTIETVSSWKGSGIGNFGEDNSGSNTDSGVYATYGQTFRLISGSDTILQSISFYVNDNWIQPDQIDFAIYLYQWDGSRITGNALFESLPLFTSQANAYEEFNILTGGVSLSVGTDYVVFMSASNFFDGIVGYGSVGLTSNPYSDGKYVFMNSKNEFSRLFNNSWGSIDAIDLAFKLELTQGPSTPVPEPSTLFLLAPGIAMIPWFRKKDNDITMTSRKRRQVCR